MFDWLTGLVAPPLPLEAAQRMRLARLQGGRSNGGSMEKWSNVALDDARWVVADIESSGLDLSRDQLIAIGAVVVAGRKVALAESFEIVLKQEQVSTNDNILIHRIVGQQQIAGADPADALLSFLEFVGDSPMVGYHAPFDARMIERACRRYLGVDPGLQWLDLANVAPALQGRAGQAGQASGEFENRRNSRGLDWWLDHYAIKIASRHNAAADALGTAQLLTALLPACAAQGHHTIGALVKLSDEFQWLQSRR